jgi:HK97 family phage major capsid protein
MKLGNINNFKRGENMPEIAEILAEIKTLGEGKVDKASFDTKITELKDAIDNRGKDLETSMATEREAAMKKLAEEFSQKLTDAVGEMGKMIPTNLPSDGDIKPPDPEKYGKSFGEFLVKVKNQDMSMKQLSENTGASGGYLVPETWSNEILKIAIEGSIVRNSNARVITMTSPTMKIPGISSTSRSSSVYGGIVTYWGTESTTLSDNKTKPAFNQVGLELNKLYGYVESYEDMIEDAIISIGPLLQALFGDAINFEEDYQFIHGNGVGKPLGVLSAPCLATVSRGTASTVNTDDITNMLGAFAGRYDKAVWITNQTTLTYLLRLQDAAGNYLWMPGMSGDITGLSPGRLYGIPLVISEKASALGTAGDLILGDWSNYVIGDKEGLRVEESPHYKFGDDIRCWKFVKRVEGKPWLSAKITPKNGSAISPFVALY